MGFAKRRSTQPTTSSLTYRVISKLRVKNMNRHIDKQEHFEDFNDPCYVVCPKCSGCAVISTVSENEKGWFAPRKLVCTGCTYRDYWEDNAISRLWRRDAKDDYFNLPLWLQVPCGKNVLFAYNKEHLQFLESFVSADIRQRSRDDEAGWSNRSAASRLPDWIKSRKNKNRILKSVKRLWSIADNT